MCKSHNLDNGNCLTCYQGFTLSNNKCVTFVVTMPTNCLDVTPGGQCTSCYEGYYVSGNECKVVSILCATYNKANGQCTSCIAGHFFQDNECVFPALYDEHCIYYESAYCSRCSPGFFVYNYGCKEVDIYCNNFDYSSKICYSCINGLTPKGHNCI